MFALYLRLLSNGIPQATGPVGRGQSRSVTATSSIPKDFRAAWRGLAIMVEVEAKANGLALAGLQGYLDSAE
jgi:hypothetical protein